MTWFVVGACGCAGAWGAPGQAVGGPGGGERGADQPPVCGAAYLSNKNSNTSPDLVFDDFVATEDTVRTVRFYGGATGDLFAGLSFIGIDIWSLMPGGDCGWTWQTSQVSEFHTLAELNSVQVCTYDGHPVYEFSMTLHNPAVLWTGERYGITIYGWVKNPNDGVNFFWSQSSELHNEGSMTIDITTLEYLRCAGADVAFAINGGESCPADYNGDGSVNTVDVLAFLNDWVAGSAEADCNGDGSVNTIDVLCFLNLWAAGC